MRVEVSFPGEEGSPCKKREKACRRAPSSRARCPGKELVDDADAGVQRGWPRAQAAKGFAIRLLATLKRGRIYLSTFAYGCVCVCTCV